MKLGRFRSAPRVWLLVALSALAPACYSARGGFWPPTERLPQLQPGVSSKADVEAVLGSPVGQGVARFTPEMAPREIWFYSFINYDGAGMSIDNGNLAVFFDGNLYDGHFWTLKGKIPEDNTRVDRQ